MTGMKRKFTSLLHFIDEEQFENFSLSDIDYYASAWSESLKDENSIIFESYKTKDNLRFHIDHLKHNLEIHKRLFLQKSVLDFVEQKNISHSLSSGLSDFRNEYQNHFWFTQLIDHSFIHFYLLSFSEIGIKSLKETDKLNTIIRDSSFINASGIRLELAIQIQNAINELFRLGDKDRVSSHYVRIINKFPLSDGEKKNLLSNYGRKLKSFVSGQIPSILKGSNSNPELIEEVAKAAATAGELLGDGHMASMAKELGQIRYKNKAVTNSHKNGLKMVIGISLALIGLVFIYLCYNFLENNGNDYEEKYAAYQKERNEFLTNRKLSVENIEFRKTVTLVDNFHYSDRDGLPLFHTYFQTNKYLDINEIDDQLYNLKNKINSDSLDVNNIFVKAFFFTTEKEKPYRTVLVKYENLHLNPDYKQVTKPNSTKSFSITSRYKTPYKLNIQLNKSYASGIIEAYAYELKIEHERDHIEAYSLNPVPELIGTFDLSSFSDILHDADAEYEELNPIIIGYKIFNKLDGEKMRYRVPVTREKEKYPKNMDPISVMYNWELTMDDETAFIRIRSEEVKGYYLVNKENGHLSQVKLSFESESDSRTDYLIQYTPITE